MNAKRKPRVYNDGTGDGLREFDVRPVLRVGDLAYYDGISAIIPCKVLGIRGESGAPGTAQSVRVKTTAERNGWPRGTEFDTFGHHVIPRAAFFWRRYGARIGYYTIEVPS